MKKLFLIAILAGATGITSCKKFLEERSQTDIIPTTVADYGDILCTKGYPDGNSKLQPQLFFLTDDVEYYLTIGSTDHQAHQKYSPIFKWQAEYTEAVRLAGGETTVINSWETYYKLLLPVNVALQYLDVAKGDNDEREWFKGQAFGLRAYYYYMLVNLYAMPYNTAGTTPDKLPGVPLKLDANVVESDLTRNSVAEVYAQIKKDIDSSIRLLEKDKREREKTFFSHVAVHLLASRVALQMEDWQAAVDHASYVLQFNPELQDLAGWSQEYSPIRSQSPETIWAYGTNKETEVNGFPLLADVSHNLYDSYEPNDLRTFYYIWWTPPELKVWFAPDYSSQKHFNDMDYMIWRSSEAYLNRAEGYIQLYRKTGDASFAQKALTDLNTLRAKRFNPGEAPVWGMMPGDELLTKYRAERRRELFFEEGHRWFDLRRYGMPRIEHVYRPSEAVTEVYVLEENDPQYVLAIPREVLDRNRSLTQNKQITYVRKPQ